MDPSTALVDATEALRRAGCVAADEEATELVATAADRAELDVLLARRAGGEPLAWIVGHTAFCGLTVLVDDGVYVPRWQSEQLARRAAELLGETGCAVDVATGAGAIAMVLRARRPQATVVATELDPRAVACARRNAVAVLEGDLDEPLPASLEGSVDVMTSVLPYVPTTQLHLLARDVRDREPRGALDGGADGLELLARLVPASRRWLREGGWLLLEAGVDQVEAVASLMGAHRFGGLDVLRDGDGDPRGISGQRLA